MSVRAPPRRVFKRQDVGRWGRPRPPSPRQWVLLAVALLLVLLLGNLLSLWIVTRANQHVAATLWGVASRPLAEPRGIVLPLYDGIALLGISLIMELRAMQIDLPIEVPHCGDLSERLRDKLEHDEALNVRVYDVCVQAAETMEVGPLGSLRPIFCDDLHRCQKRYRWFDIKVISLLFSRFEELMLVDADVMFLQNPMSLWEVDKFVSTGTLFFPDRISFTDEFLAERVRGDPARSKLHEFIETFNRAPFHELDIVPRVTEDVKNSVKHGQHRPQEGQEPSFRKPAEPSHYLKSTHAWKLRTGHHADSSVMLWSKVRQPRATAILASFVSLHHAHRPPSYGDKEFYFLACEVAESEYAFSDFGVGSIGWDVKPEERALCGDMLQFYPVKSATIKEDDAIPPLYINSDHIAIWNPDKEVLYRSNARLAEHYAGSFEEKNLPQECPFDVKAIHLSDRELDSFRRRQRFYKTAESWQNLNEGTMAPTDRQK